jgi:hypothetical protein
MAYSIAAWVVNNPQHFYAVVFVPALFLSLGDVVLTCWMVGHDAVAS